MKTENLLTLVIAGSAALVAIWQAAEARRQANHAKDQAQTAKREAAASEEATRIASEQWAEEQRAARSASVTASVLPEGTLAKVYVSNQGPHTAQGVRIADRGATHQDLLSLRTKDLGDLAPGATVHAGTARTKRGSAPMVVVTMTWADGNGDRSETFRLRL